MRICFCVDSMGSGGAERVVANLANYFSSTYKYDVSIIIVSGREKNSFYQLNDEVSLYAICENEPKKVKAFQRIKRLKRAILEIKPDLVISFLPHISIYSHFALRRTRIPHIVSERNDPTQFPKSKVAKLLRNYVFKRASAVVCQTNMAKAYFSKKIQNKTTIIFNPVSDYVEYHAYEKYDKTIIATGRLEPQKNYYCLLDGFNLFKKEHPDFALRIYGSGGLKDNLCEYIGKNNILGVCFEGNSNTWISDNKACFAYVLSSDFEGMPNSLLEALCAGIPCISTDCRVGGPKELIRNGENGFLIKCKDPYAIYKVLNMLYADSALRKKITLANLNLKSKFSLENICKKWNEVFERVLNYERH